MSGKVLLNRKECQRIGTVARCRTHRDTRVLKNTHFLQHLEKGVVGRGEKYHEYPPWGFAVLCRASRNCTWGKGGREGNGGGRDPRTAQAGSGKIMRTPHNAASLQESHRRLWARTVPAHTFGCQTSNSCRIWGKFEALWRYFCSFGGDLFFGADLASLRHLEASKKDVEMKPKCPNKVVWVSSAASPFATSRAHLLRNLHPHPG